MRKKYFLVFAMVVLFFAACSKETVDKEPANHINNAYNSYVVDMSNDGLVTDAEKDWWLGISAVKEVDETTKNIALNNKSYSITYLDTVSSKYSQTQLDRYCNNEITVSFSSSDGTFRELHYQNLISEDYFLKSDIEEPYENAAKLAEKIAAEYIQVDDYTLTETSKEISYEKLDAIITIYSFNYTKYVGEYKTGDTLSIEITSKGDVRILSIGDIGCFDTIQPTQIDTNAVMRSLLARLNELYAGVGPYTYNIVNQTLAYTPEGELAVVSQIELHIDAGPSGGYRSGIVLATIIASTGSEYSTS